MAPAKMTEPAA